MIYLSGKIFSRRHPRLGFIFTPDGGNRIPSDDIPVAADNACFANPAAYSDDRYIALLRKMPRNALFATAPDVLGDHAATVRRSVPILRQIRSEGLPAAFVAQDGWSDGNTPWDEFDVMFIGGSTDFKFRGGRAAVTAAKQRGKRVHMGRVNSYQRLRAAASIGCDTCDGTFLVFAPDNNWPRFLRWMEKFDRQTELPL